MADSLYRTFYCDHCCTTLDARYDETRLTTILSCPHGCTPPQVISWRDWTDMTDAEQERLRTLIDRTGERDEVQRCCTCSASKGQAVLQ